MSLKPSKVNTIIDERDKADLISLLIKNPGKDINLTQ